jgi:hypothetical protein
VFRKAFDRLGLPPDRMVVGSETPGRQNRFGGQGWREGLAGLAESVRIVRQGRFARGRYDGRLLVGTGVFRRCILHRQRRALLALLLQQFPQLTALFLLRADFRFQARHLDA